MDSRTGDLYSCSRLYHWEIKSIKLFSKKKEKPAYEKSIWETMQAQAEEFKARKNEINMLEYDLGIREKDLIARGGTLLPYKKIELPPQTGSLGEPPIWEIMDRQRESLKIQLMNLKARADALEMAEKNLRKGTVATPAMSPAKVEVQAAEEEREQGVRPVRVDF